MTRAIVIVITLGCGAEPTPRVPSNTNGEPAISGPRMTCYLRSGHVPPDTNPVVLVRTLDPAQQTIVERHIGDYDRMIHTQTFKISGDRFADPSDDITHTEGRLEGAAWHWTAWTTKRRIYDGTTMETWTNASARGLTEHAVIRHPAADEIIPPYRYDPVDCEPYLKPTRKPTLIDI